MHLQSDKPFKGQIIHQPCRLNAIDPDIDFVTDRLHSEMIPLTITERRLAPLVPGERVDPSTSRLIIDPTAPSAWGGIQLHLIPVNAAIHIVLFTLTPDLDTTVDPGVEKDIILQNKITVIPVGRQKRVGCVHHSLTHNGTILDEVDGFAISLNPAIEILTIEEIPPPVLGREVQRKNK